MSILNVSLPMYAAIGGAVAATKSKKRDRVGTALVGAGVGLATGVVIKRMLVARGGNQQAVAGMMHPLHPAHPYNNGTSVLNGMGNAEPPLHKNPLMILVGVGALFALMSMGGR